MTMWRTLSGVSGLVVILGAATQADACTLKRFQVHFGQGETAFPVAEEAHDEVAQFYRYVISDADRSIVIVGHTDRVGSPDEQIERSRLTALAVAAELEALGLERSSMSIRWNGGRELVRPTSEGVSEPLNRRVELFSTRPVDMARACPGPPPRPGTLND